ncbi:MAG: hypothetical protein EZS28_023854, partial [Streblomastix strix]
GRETDIKELGEGGPEDFQYNPVCINSIVPLPYYSYSPHHSIDDRFVLGVGNGRSGAIHSIGIGHKLQSIMQGKWYEKLPTIFTSRAYSGARLHSLLLVEEEKLVEFMKSLAASTICTRPFLIVGCESPPAVFVFRLDTLQISQQQINIRNKIWDDGEKLLDQMKYKLAYPTVQRPDPELVIQNGIKNSFEFNQLENKHSIRIGEGNQCSILQNELILSPVKQSNQDKSTKQIRFIEVLSGSHQYVEVFYSANIAMTRILDLFPYDRPDQILLTTFGNQICIYTSDEAKDNTINSAITISPTNQTQQSQVAQSSELINQDSHRSYLQNDGVALMIAGHNGQFATALIPLSALLDFPPELQKNNKKGGKTKFFFPSVVTTMRLFPQIVKIAEDGQIVYLYGDRAFALTWNYISQKDFKGDPFIDIAADWFIESHTKHFKDFRPKRFPPYKFNVPKVNLGYSSQKTNFSFGYPSWLSPANVKQALKNRIDNYYNLNTEETTTQLYNYFSMIQNAIDESDKIHHTYADLSTSPMTAIYNRMQILNISLTLQKRIRVIGGVQGMYGFPSTLVVLNGKAAFVFIIGSRLDDNEVTTLNKIYKLDSMKADLHNANQSKKQKF